MKISYHIFNLLQEHDCVIVPNFGAFVARNISAKISRDGSRIYPPNKEITFNKSLIKSDGLLINRISSNENISYEMANDKLSNWVVTVRQNRKNDKLEQQQIEELDSLGFIWDPHSHAWDEAFSALLKFYQQEGHCNVPVSYIEEDIKLGQWIRYQRKHKDKMSTDRLKRLNALNFSWV